MIAALYIDVARGPYAAIPGVDCWGVERDATLYDGPWPVVAHPPCGMWGRYAHLCKQGEVSKNLARIAVAQVRKWGGVLEHPRDSRLWRDCQLPQPNSMIDDFGGYTIEVAQRDWGHRANKRTFLYICGCPMRDLPAFPPATPFKAPAYRRPCGRLSTEVERMSKESRHLSPPAFALWLVEVASRCSRDTPGAAHV